MSEPPNLDPAALERLHRLGGDEFVGKMIELFLSYAAEKIGAAQKARAEADWPALAKAVHPIKSSAGNVGASRLQGLAQQIEMLAKEGRAADLAGSVDELERAFAAVKLELEAKRQSPPKPPA